MISFFDLTHFIHVYPERDGACDLSGAPQTDRNLHKVYLGTGFKYHFIDKSSSRTIVVGFLDFGFIALPIIRLLSSALIWSRVLALAF